ncbi:Gfo/Idh/MocA family protein [Deinococcus hopiensis]|uniref:Predicted dehydrogenase n=1 Tax=Deinococcus hopiensis KR-140 TaxID=695939 RepID=A0A1W1UKY0_9DEIO|nr:Gfo/Idh/MocA family oxidoreductase [Deinococcus hopiensis]SMB81722.1 Predicted dehydrogenase [Deinococcus hopiensis KR-140]
MKVGILSFAHVHAEHYAALLEGMPDVEFSGFWDDGPAVQRPVTAAQAFPTPEALLSSGIEAVIICSETSRHLEFVTLAAQAGIHVLCEKPIAIHAHEALAMEKVCREHDVTFMTAFPMRFDVSTGNVRQAVLSGDLGEVLGVNGINHSENPSGHRAWFADPSLSGGGALMDHVVHLADLLRWTFESEVAEVYARVRWTEGSGAGGTQLDTAGLLLLTLENGVQASIDCSWSRPETYPRWGHLKMDVVGEHGFMVVDAFADHLTTYTLSPSQPVQWPGYGTDPNKAMLQSFVDAVRTGAAPSVSWKDGFEALKVVLAAYESDRLGHPVRLN